jgi:hypothetical protein
VELEHLFQQEVVEEQGAQIHWIKFISRRPLNLLPNPIPISNFNNNNNKAQATSQTFSFNQ